MVLLSSFANFLPACIAYTSLLRLALPAPANHTSDSVELEHEDEHADTATIRSFRTTRTARSVAGQSLHRVSSRATLPERGERMLRELAPDDDDEDEEEEDHVVATQHRPILSEQGQAQPSAAYASTTTSYPPRPNVPSQVEESEGERRERLQQEEMDRERSQHNAYQPAPFVLGNEVELDTPPAAANSVPDHGGQESKRPSVEGAGWREAV